MYTRVINLLNVEDFAKNPLSLSKVEEHGMLLWATVPHVAEAPFYSPNFQSIDLSTRPLIVHISISRLWIAWNSQCLVVIDWTRMVSVANSEPVVSIKDNYKKRKENNYSIWAYWHIDSFHFIQCFDCLPNRSSSCCSSSGSRFVNFFKHVT